MTLYKASLIFGSPIPRASLTPKLMTVKALSMKLSPQKLRDATEELTKLDQPRSSCHWLGWPASALVDRATKSCQKVGKLANVKLIHKNVKHRHSVFQCSCMISQNLTSCIYVDR
jgi:hypothetical protein